MIRPQAWMNQRRQLSASKLHAFVHRHSGKLYLSEVSLARVCQDAKLLPHELDRAIDDLFFMQVLDVRAPDQVTHVLTCLEPPSRVAWDVRY